MSNTERHDPVTDPMFKLDETVRYVPTNDTFHIVRLPVSTAVIGDDAAWANSNFRAYGMQHTNALDQTLYIVPAEKAENGLLVKVEEKKPLPSQFKEHVFVFEAPSSSERTYRVTCPDYPMFVTGGDTLPGAIKNTISGLGVHAEFVSKVHGYMADHHHTLDEVMANSAYKDCFVMMLRIETGDNNV